VTNPIEGKDPTQRAGTATGYLCAAGAAVLWASSGTAAKVLFRQGVTPLQLVQIRVTLACVVLALALGLFARGYLRIRARDIPYFLVLGGIGMAVVQFTYFLAISKIQVAAAILLEYMAPIFVALFAVCFWRERLTWPKELAVALAVGGCYLVVEGYNLQLLRLNRVGVIAGLISAVSFAGYTLLGERGMHRYPPWTVLFYSLLPATVTWHVLYRPFDYLVAGFTVSQWGWIAYIGLMGTVAAFGLYFVGISRLRSTRASLTATLEPVTAGLMAFLLLGEALRPPQIVGGALVIAAIALLQLHREQDDLAPELIRARRKGRADDRSPG
jgi:drug/metabolite transporter (DMT)-like permease